MGLFTQPIWVILGLVLFLAGWAWALAALWAVYRGVPAVDRDYETWLNAALVQIRPGCRRDTRDH
ncbi:MAG: hypothetical protein ACQETW_10875 [Pseudomonadota bacterium]